jgi:cysteine desulfurase family protein (TIGR01976 family)
MGYDVAAVRSLFPALAEGAAHFDGPGGSQVAAPVAAAVAATMRSAVANRGTVTVAERRAEDIVAAARRAVADLLGAAAGGVVFGRSMTALTFDFARSLAAGWGPGDEVVVTRLDHDANIRPWVIAAERAGATVRWAAFDRSTAELTVDDVAPLLRERTKVVAVTAASNLFGTVPDVRAVADAAHAAGALVYVDGVHATPHLPVDVESLGADFYVCSPYKFFGPHLGVLVAAPALLETVWPDKLLPSTDDVPERFELGTLPYELLAGVTACVDVIAGLAGETDGDRRARVQRAMAVVEEHERGLAQRLRVGLAGLPGVTVHGAPARRTPTVLFSVGGLSAPATSAALAARGVNAPAGSFYAIEAARWAGLGDGGAVRAGLAPYTSDDDVDRLLEAVAAICPTAS